MTVSESQRYVIWSNEILDSIITELRCKGVDGQYEVTISPVAKDKTLKQLGALFGLWVKEESSRMGESELYVHAKWKAWFLARIYFAGQLNQVQEMWVDYFYVLAGSNDREQFEKHSKRISLSWATLTQMSDYMQAIEQHYMEQGMPLTVPDKFYKTWEKYGDQDQ